MSQFRILSPKERAVLCALLGTAGDANRYLSDLDKLQVVEMNDGGMGSLTLIPDGLERTDREFGRQIAQGEFSDSDGVAVSVTVNVDKDGNLFELDVWKVNFSPLRQWPDFSEIRVVH